MVSTRSSSLLTSRGLSFAGPSRFASNLLSSTHGLHKTLTSVSLQSLFIRGETDESDLFVMDDAVVDPLEWSGTMG